MIRKRALSVSGSFLTMKERYSAKVLNEPAGDTGLCVSSCLVTAAVWKFLSVVASVARM